MPFTVKEMSDNWGLVLFVVVTLVNVAGLFLDLVLLMKGMRTISDTAKIFPVITYVVLGWQVVGALGLCRHFVYE